MASRLEAVPAGGQGERIKIHPNYGVEVDSDK
jgi:hypothetical protein